MLFIALETKQVFHPVRKETSDKEDKKISKPATNKVTSWKVPVFQNKKTKSKGSGNANEKQ
uniref:Uncharacterized protein n=1 Tax=Rhizophagus irregularis (strain DAOM 181602 / DAOM 197198 / MUCL 43194) TaxID=747089 RepID=U9SZ73_RHIID